MKKRRGNRQWIEWICQIVGWVLFVLCALFFLGSGLKNKDMLTIIGSLLFLIACFVFIYPLLTFSEEQANTDK
jgi:high-affinity Fe2+/Pb2+ permease|nr:hypothetical protein [uncultured Desulfobacter sp.]